MPVGSSIRDPLSPRSPAPVQNRIQPSLAGLQTYAPDPETLRLEGRSDQQNFQARADASARSAEEQRRYEQTRADALNRQMSAQSAMGALLQPSAAPAPGGAPAGGVSGAGAVDEGAARAAAFARAKDQAGKIARSSLTSLQETMAGRGISGSGIEGLRTAGALGGAEDSLQDLTREQLIQDLNRSSDVSDMQYKGGLQMREQDMANRQSLAGMISRGIY